MRRLQVARALVVQNHAKGDEYVDSVFSLLEDHQLGRDAGKAIGDIALNNDGVLTKQNYSVVRVSLSAYNSILIKQTTIRS